MVRCRQLEKHGTNNTLKLGKLKKRLKSDELKVCVCVLRVHNDDDVIVETRSAYMCYLLRVFIDQHFLAARWRAQMQYQF